MRATHYWLINMYVWGVARNCIHHEYRPTLGVLLGRVYLLALVPLSSLYVPVPSSYHIIVLLGIQSETFVR